MGPQCTGNREGSAGAGSSMGRMFQSACGPCSAKARRYRAGKSSRSGGVSFIASRFCHDRREAANVGGSCFGRACPFPDRIMSKAGACGHCLLSKSSSRLSGDRSRINWLAENRVPARASRQSERFADVLFFEAGEIAQETLNRPFSSQGFDDHSHGHAKSPDAGLRTHNVRVGGNAAESLRVVEGNISNGLARQHCHNLVSRAAVIHLRASGSSTRRPV